MITAHPVEISFATLEETHLRLLGCFFVCLFFFRSNIWEVGDFLRSLYLHLIALLARRKSWDIKENSFFYFFINHYTTHDTIVHNSICLKPSFPRGSDLEWTILLEPEGVSHCSWCWFIPTGVYYQTCVSHKGLWCIIATLQWPYLVFPTMHLLNRKQTRRQRQLLQQDEVFLRHMFSHTASSPGNLPHLIYAYSLIAGLMLSSLWRLSQLFLLLSLRETLQL